MNVRPARTRRPTHRRFSDLRWGIAGVATVVAIAVVLVAAAGVKVGQTTYSAELSDAGSIPAATMSASRAFRSARSPR